MAADLCLQPSDQATLDGYDFSAATPLSLAPADGIPPAYTRVGAGSFNVTGIACGERDTVSFLALPLPFCQRLMPLLVVLQRPAPPGRRLHPRAQRGERTTR